MKNMRIGKYFLQQQKNGMMQFYFLVVFFKITR